jgi:hypothetical protein
VGEIKAHLPGAAADVEYPRIDGNCLIEKACEIAPFSSRIQPCQAIAIRIARKRSFLVKASNNVNPWIAPHTQIGNSIW